MSPDRSIRFHLNAVIQLIHAHTNRPLLQNLPRMYADCPVEIVRKDNGIYVFVNAQQQDFQVRIEMPQFLPETLLLSWQSGSSVQMVRCSPAPQSILGAPPANVTYFSGKAEPGQMVHLLCPVRYCDIRVHSQLPDGRMLFESTNFLYAGTGRTLLLENAHGVRELVQTMTDKQYAPDRFFLAKTERITAVQGVTALPVFSVRADAKGQFLAAAEEPADGSCVLLREDGTPIREFSYQAGGRVILP